MSWILLVIAGLLEVGWALMLPGTEGLTRPGPTAAFFGLLVASMLIFAKAVDTIPIGIAYGVWVGIGAVGAAVYGMVAQGDPATPARLGFLTLLIVALVGLKVSSGH